MKSIASCLTILVSFLCTGAFSNSMKDITFNVFRGKSLIGTHKLFFEKSETKLNVKIEIKFDVRFLGFILYEYQHINNEIWKNNRLISIKTSTNQNGSYLECNPRKVGQNVIPTSYWNYSLVENKSKVQVLNTQTCKFINLEIKKLGNEMIYNNSLETIRYNLIGEDDNGETIDINIWYDTSKRWVKMKFLKDNSTINYVLKGYED